MKIHYIYTLILCVIISVCTISCDDDVNDWPVDPSYDAPFRSTGFELSKLGATTAIIKYKGIIDASKYVFEFSEGDSLVFDNIVRTVEILADTLTIYSDNVAPTKREYQTVFEDFKGTTRYSARMKGIDKNNRETGYVELSFDTPAEQIITWRIWGLDYITIEWDTEKQVNEILYGVYTEGEETTFETHTLTQSELNDGAVTLDGLTPGTKYEIQLMLDDQCRGSAIGSTGGLVNGTTVVVDETSNVDELLTTALGQGHKNIALVFPLLANAAVHEIGQINIPDGIESLLFIGSSRTKELPKIFLHAVRLNGLVKSINFQNISIDGRRNASNYFFNIDNAEKHFKGVSFRNCEISNISRSLVRLAAAIDVDYVLIDNCIIYNVAVGGYGFYNTGNSGMSLKLLSIINSTMREIGDQLGDIQGKHDQVIMNYVTFCNYTTGLPKLIRWRNAPGGLIMTNNIFTGTNNDATLEAAYNNTYPMDFSSCYKTNEWTWKNYPFTNITEVDMSGEDLFVDPRNGDFHIKDGVRFAGANKAGDPRWWEN